MRIWSFAVNNLYKTGCYILEEAPWYVFFLREAIMEICDHIPSVPIPFGSKLFINEEYGEKISVKDYYGDIQCWFHVKICCNIFNWCNNKIKIYHINTDYNDLKEKFGKTSSIFKENDE